MKNRLTILLIFSAFIVRAQFGYDGLHDDRALEKLIVNYAENGVIEFKLKCANCGTRERKFNYKLINDSIILESSRAEVLKFAIRNNQLEWIQSREDSLYNNSLPRYFETEKMDSLGRRVKRIYRLLENDTILSRSIYTIESKDSSKTERHIIPNSSDIRERKIITYSFSPDSTREVIYDKIGESWTFFKDVTYWTDTTVFADELVIKENSLSKTNFFGRRPPEITESKNLLQTTFYFSDGIITKIETYRNELNLINNDLFTELIEIKPKIIKRNTHNMR